MCIYCNITNEGNSVDDATVFLSEHEKAGRAMRAASASLLALLPEVPDKEQRDNYNRIHKKMVKLRKAWNRIEQERESARYDLRRDA